MSKHRSLYNQIDHAIREAQSRGESKRSYMREHGSTNEKLFSDGYTGDIKDTAGALCRYIKATNPDIKFIRDIRKEDLQEFLKEKSLTANAETCAKYKSHLIKLERVCRSRYGRCIDWNTSKLIVPINTDLPCSIRDYVATQADYGKLKTAMQTGRSETWKSVVLSRYIGCRVNETANIRIGRYNPDGGRWGYGTVTLQGKEDGTKGGRWRTIDIISAEARKELSEAFEGRSGGQYVIQQRNGQPVKTGSITRAWERACVRQKIDLPKYNKNHSFRKMFAQQCYDLARSVGDTKTQALDYAASNQLGHGTGRKDSANTYVHNQW